MNIVREYFQQFVSIPNDQWALFESKFRPRSLRRGEFFVEAGQFNSTVALVVKGLVRKYYLTESGTEFIKDFGKEGDLIGAYSSLLLDRPSWFSMEALEATELFEMEYSDFTNFYDIHPCWERLGRMLAEKQFIKKEKREHQLLLLSARERYDEFLKDYPGLVDRIPKYHVASYLGVTPVTLSRITH